LDAVVDFQTKGFPVPQNYNVAEWALSVAQGELDESLERNGFYPNSIEKDPDKNPSSKKADLKVVNIEHTSLIWTELQLLMGREMKTLARHTEPMITNLCVTTALSVVFGIFF